MPYGMYVSAEGAQAQMARMEVISNNLANVNTPGFKRDHATFQARFAEAIDRGLVPPEAGHIEDLGGGVAKAGAVTDFSQGRLQETGQRTDMAIRGPGFFQVKRGDETYLTRAGNFLIDAGGQLVTQSGEAVLSATGAPIIVGNEAEAGPWSVSPEGSILQGDTNQPLAIVQPPSMGDLVKVGGNLFSPLATTKPLAPGERHVLSGFVESSGVNPTSAMMEMIETSRAFEANMKLIQHQDHLIGQLLGRVLRS